MSTMSSNHRHEIEEIHKTNQLTLKSLKSQLADEQKAENEELKRNFAIEKGKIIYVLHRGPK